MRERLGCDSSLSDDAIIAHAKVAYLPYVSAPDLHFFGTIMELPGKQNSVTRHKLGGRSTVISSVRKVLSEPMLGYMSKTLFLSLRAHEQLFIFGPSSELPFARILLVEYGPNFSGCLDLKTSRAPRPQRSPLAGFKIS